MPFHRLIVWAGALWMLALCGDVMAQDDTTLAQSVNGTGYRLGQGLPLGDTGFTLGGYGSAQWQTLEAAEPRIALSHFSLFLWWEGNGGFKFFSELDNEETQNDRDVDQDGRHYLSVERLYVDYSFSDALTLRAGKFLTPIGRWNQVHADPLVWTTSRPLLTREFFPDNATGLMAIGVVNLLGQPLEYTAYLSGGAEVRPDPGQDPFTDACGLRINLPLGSNLQLGFSAASFRQADEVSVRKHLAGVDFMWTLHGYELSGEGIYRRAETSPQQLVKGAFVQGVVPLGLHVSAVGRLEATSALDQNDATRRRVLGLVYRPDRAWSIKFEAVRDSGAGIVSNGMLASASVLF